MFYLIYSSYSTQQFNDEELKEILVPARQRNLFRGITGVLFYFKGKFIQLIEGSETDVKVLYSAIYNDKRHHTIQLHKEDNIEQRNFPDWKMAFKPLLAKNVEAVKGFTDMSLPSAVNVEAVMKLYQLLSDK